eukprot:TRINITY_DN13669_c0_g2_i1.p1 TRINITY_DN13669_c0_g2~~TRINITY_DN13669_c0_g2_i1.p1  ORF type:complete len:375 (+),score=57.29 TRINITY_DN13669_c0_g2_i1:121-1245(+)
MLVRSVRTSTRHFSKAVTASKGGVLIDARTADSLQEVCSVFEKAKAATEKGFQRMVILGSPVDGQNATSDGSRRSLEGFVKSLAREVGRSGSTVNLLWVPKDMHDTALEQPVAWFLNDDFKFVTGQAVPLCVTHHPTDQNLNGKTILVTGAAGGIGSEIARECSRRGAMVILADRHDVVDTLETLSSEIPNSRHVTGDVGEGKVFAEKISEPGLTLDGVVHCAGVTLDKTLKNMPDEDWVTSLKVNLYGPMEMTEFFHQQNHFHKDTTIVGISSVIGFSGNRGQTNYAAAKTGMRAWLASLPYPSYGIAPGFISTPMTRAMPPAILKATLSQSALEVLGDPIDPATVVSTVLSPAGKVLAKGQTIRVCGGFFWG